MEEAYMEGDYMEDDMMEDDEYSEAMMEAVPLEDELVNEVTRRVSARLVKRLKR